MSFSEEKKQAFIEIYRQNGLVQRSAKTIGVSPPTIANHRKKDPTFDMACQMAYKDYCESLEREAYRRAVEGVPEAVFYQGIHIADKLVYSDRLLELKLKRHMPEYRERQSIDMSVTGGVLVVPGPALSVPDWEKEFRDGGSRSAIDASAGPNLLLPGPSSERGEAEDKDDGDSGNGSH